MAKPTNEQLALPDFAVPMVEKINDDWVESSINLSEWQKHSDQGLILYFYHKDNTPGCTVQATDFSADISQFTNLGYRIIGVSKDSIDSHKNFIDKQNLTIALISDADEKLCRYFDVIKEKNMYGKKVMGMVRSTFVFNKRGKLTHAQRNLRAKGHVERLLNELS